MVFEVSELSILVEFPGVGISDSSVEILIVEVVLDVRTAQLCRQSQDSRQLPRGHHMLVHREGGVCHHASVAMADQHELFSWVVVLHHHFDHLSSVLSLSQTWHSWC